jgi:CHAT domain-containing protein
MPSGLTLSEILSLIPEGGALVAPVITSQGSAVFVVPCGAKTVTEEYVIRLDQLKDETVNDLLVGTETNPGWLRAYMNGNRQAWETAIETCTRRLWQEMMLPVHARLQELGVRRVILMPSGGLQLLPQHVAWRMVDGVKHYFMDDYEVIYAPSAFALQASRARAQSRAGQTALVVGVSVYKKLQPLHFTRAEVEEVSKLFNVQPLMDSAATPEGVRERASGAAYVHLSCHGSFAWGQDPLASAVYLAEDRPLTLADILGKMDLNSARLVTLSACETGISDIRQSPDEYVGLPAGFLQAGAAGVVSSLWSVNDLSTALLMIRFYENHLKDKQPPAQALRQAQLWLRDVTNAELGELFDAFRKNTPDAQVSPRMPHALASQEFRKYTLDSDPKGRPFAHPYYWAAFAFYGA